MSFKRRLLDLYNGSEEFVPFGFHIKYYTINVVMWVSIIALICLTFFSIVPSVIWCVIWCANNLPVWENLSILLGSTVIPVSFYNYYKNYKGFEPKQEYEVELYHKYLLENDHNSKILDEIGHY